MLALLYSALLQAGSCYHSCAILCLAKVHNTYGTADGQSGPAVLAACTARRWLARNAAGVKHLLGGRGATAAPAYTSMVSCLPALEHVELYFLELTRDDLGSLLEALSWCPRLRSLDINMIDSTDEGGNVVVDAPKKFPALGCAPAFAKLRSLTQLRLSFGNGEAAPHTLSDLVVALAPLTGLAELCFYSSGPAVLPVALRQLKRLRSLKFVCLIPCVFEAGGLDLPLLQSLEFHSCVIQDADMLLGITALQSLTRIEFCDSQRPPVFAQLVHLPRLQHAVVASCRRGARPGLSELPAHMGLLCATLVHMNCYGQGLTQFPPVLTQLVALKCLQADWNDFAELPAAITALSRLTELTLGRVATREDPLQLHNTRTLDVRALGDLSGFPVLCKLTFEYCEVRMCASMLGAVRHASLASFTFIVAHPAPECALMVLQLRQTLRDLRRGNALKFKYWEWGRFDGALRKAQGRAPFQKFKTALEACGL